jgi:hypothetical protein
MTDGKFHHLVGVRDISAGRAYCYADGALGTGGDVADTAGSVTNTDSVKIGGGETETWLGVIGEVRVYNRALSPLEIQHNYLATKWRYR